MNHYERENEFEYEVENYTEEELLTSSGDFSFMSFFLGGVFANFLRPKKAKIIPFQNIPSELDTFETPAYTPPQAEKKFLKTVWLLEEEIKTAQAQGKWVRLYCLLQTVRHLCNGDWKATIEGNSEKQDFLDQNLLSLLHYVQDLNPEIEYWPKVSDRVKNALEKGDLRVEIDDLSFTFEGKNLREEPWPKEFFKN